MTHNLAIAALALCTLATGVPAHAVSVTIEGVFDEEFQYTNGDGPTFSIPPVPFRVTFELAVEPDAAVQTSTNSFGTFGSQTHASSTSQSDDYVAPRAIMQPALDKLQSYHSVSFNQGVFENWPNPQYSSSESVESTRALRADGRAYTSWTFQSGQQWRTDGLPGNDGLTESEFWGTSLLVTLQRPATYTAEQAAAPMTDSDLAAFLAGFEEAGGVVSVFQRADYAHWTTEIPEANDERYTQLSGTFRLVDTATAPIPEPSTWALLAAGLVLLGSRIRLGRPSPRASAT